MTLAGVLLLLCGAMGLALAIVKEEERNVACTGALLELVVFVRDSVELYSMSLGEILAACSDELLQRCGFSWENARPEGFIELARSSTAPDRESREAFEEFAEGFGKSYRGREVQRCELCIERLRGRARELSERLPAKRKMIFGISACGALALLVILL